MRLLLTRPKHDLITRYLCVWSEEVVDLAHSHSIKTCDLEGKKATREMLESYLKGKLLSFLFLNGHGNADVITGHENEPMVDSASPLKGLIIYARSCDAGQRLGGILVKNGALAFIGYKRKFICGYTPEKMWKPLEDDIAKLFLAPSNLIPAALIKGNTVSDAHRRSRDEMYKNFRRMISSNATYEEKYAARWLWSNLNSQVLLGDPNATM